MWGRPLRADGDEGIPISRERCEVMEARGACCRGRRAGSVARWDAVVRSAVEQSTAFLFLDAAPLLEEEQGTVPVALLLDTLHPCWEHWSGARATLAADDDPIDTVKVD